ncbi:uncharacterized protein PV06_00158 [Exophiala oligosperma]|uniref:N-acetyltransferase domain-containing protein n=1 Tax=Exophiala oligosperma TaxID=215243 RepID=A0A0D2DWL1_9EURO|nr:uncharacterized protein PV06_00158 [Exophiala oligosperma]KIW47463.1 hypothetical protein PV06_00158 [Exophiala oligosperma]
MALAQRDAQESDITVLCDIFFNAFANDLVMKQCFPDVPDVRAFWENILKKGMADPKCHTRCVVDTALPGSPVIAYSRWVDCDKDAPPPEGPQYPSGGNVEVSKIFFPQLRKKRMEIMKGREYWYLGLLCCSPSHQGRGAGRMLLEYGLGLVDKEGKEAYVEASPPGAPVYKKFGFKEVDKVVMFDGQFTELLMLRDGKQTTA